MDITPLTEWGRQISHLQARELTSARHHEPTVWGLDTDRQSCDTVWDVQGYRTVCEAAMLEGTASINTLPLSVPVNVKLLCWREPERPR